MNSNKRVVAKNVNSSNVLEIDVATTLSFYIVERIQNTVISTIDYQMEKIAGRNTEVLTSWTGISMTGIEDDIYSFDYTVTGVTTSDKIKLKIKVVDEDGIEAFINILDLEITS